MRVKTFFGRSQPIRQVYTHTHPDISMALVPSSLEQQLAFSVARAFLPPQDRPLALSDEVTLKTHLPVNLPSFGRGLSDLLYNSLLS